VSVHDPRLAGLLGPPAPAAGLARLLASLNPSPEPEVPPEPAIDYAALLAEARAEGEAAGRIAGEAEGRAAAEAELVPLRHALIAATDAARAACVIDEDKLRPLLAQLVEAVAATVLMAELTAGRRALAPLVAAALAEVAEGALPTLSAHPDTLALISADLPPGLIARADAALPAGHVAIAGPDYRIEAGLAERLARLLAVLP
jgi:flagellar biosynthesis/type III secretory pathway protein FliH